MIKQTCLLKLRLFILIASIGLVQCVSKQVDKANPATASKIPPTTDSVNKIDLATQGSKSDPAITAQTMGAALLQRETPITNLKTFEVESPNKTFKFKVSAKEQPSLAQKDNLYYEAKFNIGTQATLDCNIYEKRVDTALLFNGLKTEILKKAKIIGFTTLHADRFGTYPFLNIDFLVQIQNGPSTQTGQFKAYVIQKNNTNTLFCYHDEVGYTKSVRTILENLIESFESKKTVYHYKELSVFKINELQLGFTETYIFPGENAHKVYLSFLTKIIPSSTNDFNASDGIIAEVINSDGAIENGTYASMNNGVEDYFINLTSDNSGTLYSAKGRNKGKPISELIATKNGLMSSYKQTIVLAETFFKNSKLKSITLNGYAPELAPGQEFSSTFQFKNKSKTSITVDTEIETAKVEIEIEPDGSTRNIDIKVGDLTVKSIRIFKDGKY